MPLLNYVYISKTKLGIYYPQVPPSLLAGASAKVGINVGFFSAELATKQPEITEDIAKVQRIVQYLDNAGELGTIEQPKAWFRGEITAGSIIDGPKVFFGAAVPVGRGSILLCLGASLKHMIGEDYHADDGALELRAQPVGPTRSRVFSLNSNTIGFSESLDRTGGVLDRAAENDFVVSENARADVKTHLLSTKEKAVLKRCRFLNPLIRFCHPYREMWDMRRWKTDLLLAIFSAMVVAPIVSLFIGPQVYLRKRNAIIAETKNAVKTTGATLTNEERRLLRSIQSVVSAASRAPPEKYEVVAVTLMKAEVEDTAVIFASPLYMAIVR